MAAIIRLKSLMTYTAGGQLYFSVTPGGALTYDFNWHWYDASGRRVMSQIVNRNSLYPWPHPDSTGAPRTYYVYDGSDVALELVRNGGTWRVDRRFITGGVDRQLVGRLYQNGYNNYVFVSNFQGTTVKVLKSDGTEETATGYFARDPYGALVGVTGSGGQPLGGLGYTGAGTPNARGGFVYMRNRWYDPQTGRFLTQDPIGLAGGVNLYAYAGNNPIAFTDPFGLKVCYSGTQKQITRLKTATENATDSDITLDKNNCVSKVESRGNSDFDKIREGFQSLVDSKYTFGVRFSREFSHANGVEARIYERYNALAYPATVNGQCKREQVPWVLTQVVGHELAHLYPRADGTSPMAGEDAAVGAENVFNRSQGKPERCEY